METINYLDSQTECLGAINATLRRHTFALERLAKAIENIEQQGTKEQEAN
jgi:hypothetical protein